MDCFLKRKLTPASDNDGGTSGDVMENIDGRTGTSIRDANATNTNNIVQCPLRISRHEVNFDELPYDPADIREISDYIGEKLQNEIRRKYLIRGPFRPPPGFKCPQKIIAGVPRRFQAEWFTKYDWLEHSEKVDTCLCLYCYLFRDSNEGQGGNDAFAKDGWDGFNKSSRLQDHVGIRPNSFHNTAVKRCNNLMKPNWSIANALNKQKDVTKEEYLRRLNTAIDATQFLLHQGLAFRGHDESEESKNKGNYRELVDLLEKQNNRNKQLLRNAQMVAPHIQRDLANCFAQVRKKFLV
jgi:hypothetical protein